jgi:hypothetical protein
MSYYNCCGIRPKHSNISKRVGEWGYYNLCGIRPKHSNISKRGGGITICVVLDQNRGNVMFYQLVANLQSMLPS